MPSAPPPRAGDLFTVRGRRVVGRVISIDAIVGPTHGCILVYLYADARLSPGALLSPPLLTTRAAWSRGLFQPLRHEPLLPDDLLDAHAFRDARGALTDELGRPIGASPGAVGEYRLHDVDAIEEALSRAPAAAYDPPQPGSASTEDLGAALRDVVTRWVASVGRPPTREEWSALYAEAVDEAPAGKA